MTVHIIGGGVAGLAAAMGCVQRGVTVALYEASAHLGGRCRSYHHTAFGCDLDNGAHAVLSNNAAVAKYLNTIGASERLKKYGHNGLSFVDVRDSAKWQLRIPQCLWNPAARPSGTTAWDILRGAQLGYKKGTVAQALSASTSALEKLWEPLCTAALNTPIAEADAALLAPIVRGMALPGGLFAGLKLPEKSLSHTYIEPAEKWLTSQGAVINRQSPVRKIVSAERGVDRLIFDKLEITLSDTDSVVLAVPPWSPLLAQLDIHTEALTPSPIVNLHFQIQGNLKDDFVGVIGGLSQWLWIHNNIATVTISAADSLMAMESELIAARAWSEIAPLLSLDPATVPPAHVVKERRATLRHTMGINHYRPPTRTHLTNLFLAGDWVNTGLPCTLESAMQSGFSAAVGCLKRSFR